MEARVIIEMATVWLAVMRADEAALAELKENVRKQKEAIRNRNVEAFIKMMSNSISPWPGQAETRCWCNFWVPWRQISAQI